MRYDPLGGGDMSEARETYVVNCHNCQASFDALDTPWCSCLVTERTLVCPSCLSCFCKAPPAYKQRFWREAPKTIWERKFQEHRQDFEPPPNPDPSQAVRPLVLLVDDEKDILRIGCRVIESLGYGLVIARNGTQGLELARLYKPDLILSDALMPMLDGREMCKRVKEDPALAGIKVVVMTALYTNVKYRTEAFKVYKVDDYLAKPLEFQQLRTILQKHLS